MTANKPMTGAQLDELMAVAMRMQSDSEKMGERSVSMFAYAVQVAVLEIRETRCKYEELQSQNADLAVQLANAESTCRGLAAENGQMLRLLTDISENHDEYVNADEYLYAGVPMDYVSEINTYVSHDGDAENPFKETDAYLAEVRAQGVELFAASLKVIGGHEHPYSAVANEFAAKLRKGAAL